MKVTFTMGEPDAKKHSVRFDGERVESVVLDDGTVLDDQSLPAWAKNFKPSFYVPMPVGTNAKRLRVTIEELL